MVPRNGKYGKFYGCSSYPKCKETLNIKDVKIMLEEAKNADKPKREFKPSAYQQDVFTFITDGEGNAVVEAVAGSGKTTTIVKALNLTKGKVLFCAFNKHIADELKRRAPAHVKVGTLHSIGFAALRQHLPYRPEVDGKKLWNIVKEVLPVSEDYALRAPLAKLVSLTKSALTDPEDKEALDTMATYYGVELNGDADRLIELVPLVIGICLERTHVIDFDDMIWMPVVLNLAVESYDWVFIDEVQDLNACQIDLVLRLTNSTGRVVAVGDRNQSIYGFRGADVNAIPNVIEALGAKVLPLSITYRCPKEVVKLAKELVPQIEAAEWAEDGEVHECTYNRMMLMVEDDDLILCRVNAPLVKTCYSLIRQGKKAVIRGRDIGRSLQNMIDRLKPLDVHDLLDKIRAYKWEQAEKYRRAGKEDRIQGLYDRCDTLIALCDGIRDLSELRFRITDIFDDITKSGVILSSVHRAKGDESDRVWILQPQLMPHPLAVKPWQLEQEQNIKYVALTRSKMELVFVV
jgi:DNA helicase-2/ATP-dependent DNA helicase PcrA